MLACLVPGPAFPEPGVVPVGVASPVDFGQDIRPVFSNNCIACHGLDAGRRQAGLRLDTGEGLGEPLESGAIAVVPRDLSSSELWRRITHEDPAERMPPERSGKSLQPEEIERIRRWIQQGAPYAAHWAFVRPRRSTPPAVNDVAWPAGPVDRFVLARLEAAGLEPSPEVEPRILIRRLSFDLRGLPPTPEEVSRFLADEGDGAYERLVDRWLASPRYGERMAQPWLDAARYADTTGHAADAPRTMWLYRDWVIDALNRNLPFDQFTVEQLAGDMIPGATQAQKIATGFHRNSMQALGNNPRKEESRVKGIVDRLDTTGRVWLGLTLACAECHDHKYDPVSTREYYRIFAIFNNVPHHGERFKVHGPRLEVLSEREQKQWNRHEMVIVRARRALQALDGEQPEAKELLQQIEGAEQAQAEVKSRAVAAQVMEELPEPRPTFVHVRGDFENHGEAVTPGTPSFLPRVPAGQPVNRLTFAKWLVDGSNPLPARVTVNRFWAHYFGQGLVATTDDFGVRGAPPSHPQLLDWLAVELVETGWDMKRLHRLIVTSATYRQSSRMRPALARRDPGNRLLGRGPRLRLPAEQVRDNALAVSGLLAPRIGGPSVFPLQPEGVGEFRDESAGKWQTSEGEDRYRRSLYTFWQRMSPYPSLTIFDAPSRERSCVRRLRTNTPLQALALLNDPAYVEMAEALARRIIAHCDGAESRVEYAFELVLARAPEREELARFLEFGREQSASGARDDLDVWTSVAQVLLNMDETITKE